MKDWEKRMREEIKRSCLLREREVRKSGETLIFKCHIFTEIFKLFKMLIMNDFIGWGLQ